MNVNKKLSEKQEFLVFMVIAISFVLCYHYIRYGWSWWIVIGGLGLGIIVYFLGF